MQRPRVLSVGQCGVDHGSISRYLEAAFDAQVADAATGDQALETLRSERFDLVLVNRIGDLDGAPGVDFIRSVKTDHALASTPVMLVSNLADAQAEAIALGALPGFGKAEIQSPATRTRLADALTNGRRAEEA
jgi:two-component system, chemotaxis family, chemotaxis protein CheY